MASIAERSFLLALAPMKMPHAAQRETVIAEVALLASWIKLAGCCTGDICIHLRPDSCREQLATEVTLVHVL